jgi:hypothetical protein
MMPAKSPPAAPPKSSLPVDEGLLVRLRTAGETIEWREEKATEAKATKGGRGRARGKPANPRDAPRHRVRRALLHEQEARVEEGSDRKGTELAVDSGPLGALVLLLEIDRRGLPTRLVPRGGGERAGFDEGALEATWARAGGEPALAVPISQLVTLARYAL